MPNTVVTLTILEAEVNEAKQAAEAFTGLPSTATAKELLAGVANEVIQKWRTETKPQAKGLIT